MRAITYTRVSTEDQGDNYSLGTQLDACRRYAAQHDLSISAECTDTATGSILDRPGLTKVRQIIAAGGCDALIVYAQDRLTRNLAHMLLLRDELHAAGVTLHTVSRGQSTDSAESRLFDSIEGAFAEFERLKIRERSLRGKRGKLEAGKPLGQGSTPPYGYRWQGRKRDKALVIDEAEAATVRQIAGWYLDAVPVTEICRRLDAAGIPTPAATRATDEGQFTGRGTQRRNGWARPSIYAMLRSPTYKGEYVYPSHNITVPIPAILSADVWQAIQAKLSVGRERSQRNAQRTYLLRTRLTCVCGHALAGRADERGERVHRYYSCTSKAGDTVNGSCAYRTCYRADHLESRVWQWIVDDVLIEARIIEAISHQEDDWADRRATLEAERAAYQRQIDTAAAQVTKITQLFAADVLTLEEVADQKRQIDAAKRGAHEEITRVNRELDHAGPTASDVAEILAFAAQVRSNLDNGVSAATQARVIELLDVRGVVTTGEDGTPWLQVEARLTRDTGSVSIVSTSLA